MESFDYNAAAELFPSRRYAKSSRDHYRRFKTAAEAIRYIIEDVPGTWLIRPSSLARCCHSTRADGSVQRSRDTAHKFRPIMMAPNPFIATQGAVLPLSGVLQRFTTCQRKAFR